MAALAAVPSSVEIDRALCAGRGGLIEFIRRAWRDANVQPVDFVDGPHLETVCAYLEAFVSGLIPVLLVNVPPGHMKSLGCSVFLPAWQWGPGGKPGTRFVATSYGQSLAFRDADMSRELIASQWYQERWGDGLPPPDPGEPEYRAILRTKAVERYRNVAGGYRYSCAIDSIMGEGGDYVLNDDPHNVQQAESDTVREDKVRKMKLALPTRVRTEKGGYMVIMQRLHSRDYAGHMIRTDEDLVHVCLPARFEYDHPHVLTGYTLDDGTELPADHRLNWDIYEQYCELRDRAEQEESIALRQEAKLFAAKHNGELLWPQFMHEKRVAKLESTLGPYGTAGQLQQRPAPRGGGILERAWLEDNIIDVDDLPPRRTVVRGWDLAGSTRKTSPYTAGVRVSRCGEKFYIEHVVRKKWTPSELDDGMKGTAKSDGRHVVVDFPQDPGQAGKYQVRSLVRALRGFVLRWSPESGSKESRAEIMAPPSRVGDVYLVRGSWNDAFLDEWESFPNGDFKDQIDAASRAFGRLILSGRPASGGASSGSY